MCQQVDANKWMPNMNANKYNYRTNLERYDGICPIENCF